MPATRAPTGGMGPVDIDRLAEIVAADVDESVEAVRDVVERVAAFALGDAPPKAAVAIVEADGERAARDGVLPERLLDRYLSTLWAIWQLTATPTIEKARLLSLGERLLHTADNLVAGVASGYRAVERDLIARNAEARRAFLEELLGAVAVDPASIGRLRRISARNGVDPAGTYRLVAAVDDRSETDDGEALTGLLRLVSVRPSSADVGRPGVTLPQVLAWRGRAVALVRASWPGMPRVQEGLERLGQDGWCAVASPPTTGVENLAPALARLLDTLRTARRVGHAGWVEHPDDFAVERLLLADDELAATVVERELGPILADARMGEELLTTLDVYFETGQNMRETARRLHLANRTVAYRLERVEVLRGKPLEGDERQHLVVALLARRLLRERA